VVALVLFAAATATAAPPTIVRTHVGRITTASAILHLKIDTGGLATSYRVTLVDPCPEPEECILDARVGEATLRAASHPRNVTVPLAKPNPPFVEAGLEYEYWVFASNAAGEASATGVFATKH
jgi:hypothetical protein